MLNNLLRYKRPHTMAWGLRQKYGKKTQGRYVCKPRKPPNEAECIAKQFLAKPTSGCTADEVKMWSKHELAQLDLI